MFPLSLCFFPFSSFSFSLVLLWGGGGQGGAVAVACSRDSCISFCFATPSIPSVYWVTPIPLGAIYICLYFSFTKPKKIEQLFKTTI